MPPQGGDLCEMFSLISLRRLLATTSPYPTVSSYRCLGWLLSVSPPCPHWRWDRLSCLWGLLFFNKTDIWQVNLNLQCRMQPFPSDPQCCTQPLLSDPEVFKDWTQELSSLVAKTIYSLLKERKYWTYWRRKERKKGRLKDQKHIVLCFLFRALYKKAVLDLFTNSIYGFC